MIKWAEWACQGGNLHEDTEIFFTIVLYLFIPWM